jgi:exoribonuclease-2
VDENKHIFYSRTKREAPGRILVSEIMILANWMMARFLVDNNVPAIFRSQPEPKERLYEKEEGTLYQHWMQRKFLNRFVLSPEPDSHSGLGLDAYVTGTSPIRKYTDLITQRQIRSVLGLETPYTKEEIEHVISRLHQPLSLVSRIQNQRKRYWLLKYLEEKIGDKEEAIVLGRRRNNIQVLIPEYMIECELPQSSGKDLKPRDYVQLTIQHVNARKDIISVYVG